MKNFIDIEVDSDEEKKSEEEMKEIKGKKETANYNRKTTSGSKQKNEKGKRAKEHIKQTQFRGNISSSHHPI